MKFDNGDQVSPNYIKKTIDVKYCVFKVSEYIFVIKDMCVIMSICEQLYMYICCHKISNK